MQPAASTLIVESAARATRGRRDGGRTSPSRRVARLDGLDNLALLERYGGLRHDRFVTVQSGLDIDRSAEITADHDVLKVQLVSRPHDHHPGALRVEDHRR